MKRAALYLRVSTDEQTVANQRPALMKLAKARGLLVVRTYEENASAAKARPQFDAMIAAAHLGDFDTVIVWSLDRFGRSALGNLQAVIDLDAKGVRVVSAQETWLEMDGPVRQLLIFIISWVAEQERARLIERTVAGMARARAEGKQIGRPQVNAPRGIVLSLAASGLSQRRIARRLKVSQASVSRVLARKDAWTCPKCGPATDGPVCPKCGQLCARGKSDAKGASAPAAGNPAKSRARGE